MTHPTEHALRTLLHSTLLGLAVMGCGKKEAPVDPSIPDPLQLAKPEPPTAPEPALPEGWTPYVCADTQADLASKLTPATPVDFVSLRVVQERGEPRVTSEVGQACATATDATACTDALSRIHTPFESTECAQICIEASIVTTAGDTVKRWVEPEDKVALLAPIDTPEEAWLLARNTLDGLGCEANGSWKKTGDGFVVRGKDRMSDCPVQHDLVELAVATNGAVKEVTREPQPATSMCIGRLPEGLEADRAALQASLPAFFAETARLEAASVFAFERMVDELEQAGAPNRLIERARDAAADERRHTQLMAHLATQWGAVVTLPACPKFRPRSLEAMALENAVEGCVRETFGAAVGLYQSRHAARPLRNTMGAIAHDEIRHAALSWDVHTWLMGQLDAEAQSRVEAARTGAIADLRAPTQEHHQLGLPDDQATAYLLEALHLHWGHPAEA